MKRPLVIVAVVFYLFIVSGVVWAMFSARESVIQAHGTPDAQDNWQKWRDKAKEQAEGKGPVQRRVPKSAEPPALALMRDYFAECLGGVLLLTTGFYFVMAYSLIGVLGKPIFAFRCRLKP